MKNIKLAVLFLLFTITIPTLPALRIDNILNNITFGINITYEAPGLFELGDIKIECGTSNNLTLYDSLKKREDHAKLIALKKETQDIQNRTQSIKEETRAIRKSTYNLYLQYDKKE